MLSSNSLEPPDSFLEQLAATPEPELLARGSVLDQYRIVKVIGEGGMGVVYGARDLRLDRDVAIKVGLERSAATLARVSREAIALARLAHPNVVTVHGVGDLGGRPYVVMEHVTRGTARQWVVGKSWHEIVELYIAAGRGLAAAHRAGLVHRDFKPDNVLVGDDGRPRVADFGLARPTDASEAIAGGRSGEETRAGGTAAYMAPEQLARRAVDARADQFAYCVSLWEALFGERPFPQRTGEELAYAEPKRPSGADAPKRVEQILRRGMAFAPEDRWPSLELLVEELARGPRRPRLAWFALAAGAAVVASGLALHRESAADPCAIGAASIREVWTPDRAGALAAAIAPTGARPWLVTAAARARTVIDGWTYDWSKEYTHVCAATRTWSAELVTKGYACLDQRKRELVAGLDAIASSGEHADSLIGRIAVPATCGDASYLAASVAPPRDVQTATRVASARDALAKVEALEAAQAQDKVKALLPQVVAQAKAIEYPPLAAQVLRAQGNAASLDRDHDAAIVRYRDAYFRAREIGDEETAATSAAAIARELLELSRDADAMDWARLSEVDARASSSQRAEMESAAALAMVTREHGDQIQALTYADRYVELARARHSDPAPALDLRARVRDRIGDYQGALADLDAADRETRDRYGDHPQLVMQLDDRALILEHVARPDEAVATARAAVALAHELVADDSPLANNARSILAVTLKDNHGYAEALSLIEQATVYDRAHDGERGYNVASDLNDHADTLSHLHRIAEATTEWKRAADIFREIEGPDGYDVALVEYNLWNGLYSMGRPLEAAPQLAHAVAVLASTPKTQAYGCALVGQSIVAVKRGDLAHGEDAAKRGLAVLGADDHVQIVRAQLALARVAIARRDRRAAHDWLAKAKLEAANTPDSMIDVDAVEVAAK